MYMRDTSNREPTNLEVLSIYGCPHSIEDHILIPNDADEYRLVSTMDSLSRIPKASVTNININKRHQPSINKRSLSIGSLIMKY